MNPKRCDEYDYINFLVAAQKSYSCLEASRVQPTHAPAHDAITRCLHSMNPNNDALWQEAEPMIEKDKGLLVLDDSTLDKPYAQKIPYRHWSGKHHDLSSGQSR